MFDALRSNRDRALVSFYLSSGVRASELPGLRHGDLDAGHYIITVTSKGSRARQAVPASVDSFVWLALYLAEQPPMSPGGPVWWTRRSKPVPLNDHAMRAVLRRANERLGTNWSLHDFRHTAAPDGLQIRRSRLLTFRRSCGTRVSPRRRSIPNLGWRISEPPRV